ncbi:transcription termination/antitermination protein NusG [Opitutales bacterium]|mgnify:FL=1|jgi:transcriptional antiterminator NusG|nr:transcription termination/antitermination protein NusG [Opitutales bacterium]
MSEITISDYQWYALQCLSNHEDKVRRYLAKYKEESEEFAQSLKEVLVPIETVSEVKNGKKMQRDRKFYPGYVFVEMKLFDRHGMLLKDPWYKIKGTDGVINFIGKDNPTALSKDEIGRILRQVQDAAGKEVPKVQFTVGEVVKILDGPFLNLTGDIDEIDATKGTLKVSVSIFGRFTPVELEFWQVEKAEEE